MSKIIRLILAIGAIIALIVFGYTAGYQFGCKIGEDLTATTEASNEAATAITIH